MLVQPSQNGEERKSARGFEHCGVVVALTLYLSRSTYGLVPPQAHSFAGTTANIPAPPADDSRAIMAAVAVIAIATREVADSLMVL